MPTIRFFAAAADVIGSDELLMDASTVGELRARIRRDFGESAARVVDKCSVLVDGVRASSDEASISESDVVDILPPFAGG